MEQKSLWKRCGPCLWSAHFTGGEIQSLLHTVPVTSPPTVFPSVTPTQSKNPLWWFDLTNQWCMCNHYFWCAPSSFSLGFDFFFCRMKQRSAQRCKVSPLSQTWLYTGREIAFKMWSFFCRWCSSLSSAGPVLKMQQLQAVVHSGALMLPSLEKLVFLPLLLSMRSGVVDEL